MQRRELLTALTGAVAASAGCAAPFASEEPASLGDPAVTRPDEGVAFYNFRHDDEPAASVDVAVRRRETPRAQGRVLVEVTPGSGWETSAVRFGLRAPARLPAGALPARVFLEVSDGGPYPSFSLRVSEDRYAVVELDGLAERGLETSTLSFALIVDPRTATESLSVQSTTTLRSPDGTRVVASVTDEMSMPTE